MSSSSSVAAAPTRKGSVLPRIYTPPLTSHLVDEDTPALARKVCECGCGLTDRTSWGFECVEFLQGILRWDLMPWQRWLYVHALERNEAGTGLRYKTIVILIARQNGKTQWLKGLGLWKLYLDGAKQVLISAQNLEMAETTLAEAVADVRRNPLLRKEYRGFSQTNGKFKLRLAPTKDTPEEPRSWRAAVAGRKGGRSLSVDLAILDELREHQNWQAWNAIAPTTTARRGSLVVAASNAGDATSVVLASLRSGSIKRIIGRNTEQTRTGFFEWSVPEDADPTDPVFWPLANPALGYLFDEEELYGYLEAKEDDLPGFQTEHLCQWVLSLTPSVVPEREWAAGISRTVRRIDGRPVYASVEVNAERTRGYIGIAAPADRGEDTDPDDVYGEVIAAHRGTSWIVRWFEDPAHPERLTRFAGVVVQARGAPASSLIDDLKRAGGAWITPEGEPCAPDTPGAIKQEGPLKVIELGGTDLTDAYSDGLDMISQGRFWHRPQPALDQSAGGARAKFLGDAVVIDRKHSTTDASPIIALIQASWALSLAPEEEPRSAYEDGGLSVV